MTPAIIFVFAAIGGLIYGSFLNVLLWRLPEQKGIGGRSHCRSCHHQLAWYDLVPILSFIILRGKCRYCRERIHIRYPFVELAVAIVMGTFFAVRTPSLNLETIIAVFGLLILVSLFFFDLFYLILPDVLVFPAIGLYALYDFTQLAHPLPYLLTALLAAGFFAILYAVSGGKKLGFGDVKLALLLGLMFGYPLGFVTIVLGIWLAALVSMGLLLTGRATRADALPLGSFLTIVAIVSIIFYHETFPFISLFRW